MTVDESVHEVRKQRPGSIENRQINSLHDYFNHIKNKLILNFLDLICSNFD